MTSLFCIIAVRSPQPARCLFRTAGSRRRAVAWRRCTDLASTRAAFPLVERLPLFEGILFSRARRRAAVRLVTNVERESGFCIWKWNSPLYCQPSWKLTRDCEARSSRACRWIASTWRATRGFTTRASVWSMSFKYVRTFESVVRIVSSLFLVSFVSLCTCSFCFILLTYIQFHTYFLFT